MILRHPKIGAGIARQIAKRWPEALNADRAFPVHYTERLGHYSSVLTYGMSRAPLRIINAYTQYGLGKQGEDVFEYAAFQSIINNLRKELHPALRIGIPYIGMGLAGGDKTQIIPMIDDLASTHNVTLVSYTDHKSVAAFNDHFNRRKD